MLIIYVLGIGTGIGLVTVTWYLMFKFYPWVANKLLNYKFNQVLANNYYKEDSSPDNHPRVEDV